MSMSAWQMPVHVMQALHVPTPRVPTLVPARTASQEMGHTVKVTSPSYRQRFFNFFSSKGALKSTSQEHHGLSRKPLIKKSKKLELFGTITIQRNRNRNSRISFGTRHLLGKKKYSRAIKTQCTCRKSFRFDIIKLKQ